MKKAQKEAAKTVNIKLKKVVAKVFTGEPMKQQSQIIKLIPATM